MCRLHTARRRVLHPTHVMHVCQLVSRAHVLRFTQILLPGGSKDIPIGVPALVLVEEKGDVDKFKTFTPADAAPDARPLPGHPAPPPASESEPKHEPAAPAPPHKPVAAAGAAAPASGGWGLFGCLRFVGDGLGWQVRG